MYDILTDIEKWYTVILEYKLIAPVIGMGLVMLESLIPMLPLFAFITLNVYAFGPILGYLYSLIGTIVGSYIVFIFFRHFISRWFHQKMQNYERVNRALHWVDDKGITPIFILMCFPLAPSSIINIAAGLSNVRKRSFIICLCLAKPIMILFWTYIGYSLTEILENPIHLIIAGVIMYIVMKLGKKIDSF